MELTVKIVRINPDTGDESEVSQEHISQRDIEKNALEYYIKRCGITDTKGFQLCAYLDEVKINT